MADKVHDAAHSALQTHVVEPAAAALRADGHHDAADALGVHEYRGNLMVGIPEDNPASSTLLKAEYGYGEEGPKAHLRRPMVWEPDELRDSFYRGLS